jgi:hypothetical protein
MSEEKDDIKFSQIEETSHSEIEPELTTQEKYHALLIKAKRKGCGKFQIASSTIVMMCLIGFGYIEYGLGYLELMPEFTCIIQGVS